MSSVARVGPGPSQDLLLGLPHGCQGHSNVGHHLLLSQVHSQEAGSPVECAGLKLELQQGLQTSKQQLALLDHGACPRIDIFTEDRPCAFHTYITDTQKQQKSHIRINSRLGLKVPLSRIFFRHGLSHPQKAPTWTTRSRALHHLGFPHRWVIQRPA